MASTPHRPGSEPVEDLDEETKRILDERLATFDEDLKTARPAAEVIRELREKFRHPAPR